LLGDALILPVGLISAAFLTRTLGLGGYGLVGVVFAAVGPVAWIAASMLGGRAAIQLISVAVAPVAAASAVIRFNLWFGLVGWGLFCAASPLLAMWFDRPGIAGVLMLAGAEILLLPLARAHRDTLTALGRYSRVGVAAAIHHLVRLVLVIVFVTAGLNVAGVILALILARIAELLWCRAIEAPPLRRGHIRDGRLVELVSMTFFYALCLQLFNKIDVLLLTALGGSNKVLSLYTAAQASDGPRTFLDGRRADVDGGGQSSVARRCGADSSPDRSDRCGRRRPLPSHGRRRAFTLPCPLRRGFRGRGRRAWRAYLGYASCREKGFRAV
jgi:hypothetical protein